MFSNMLLHISVYEIQSQLRMDMDPIAVWFHLDEKTAWPVLALKRPACWVQCLHVCILTPMMQKVEYSKLRQYYWCKVPGDVRSSHSINLLRPSDAYMRQ